MKFIKSSDNLFGSMILYLSTFALSNKNNANIIAVTSVLMFSKMHNTRTHLRSFIPWAAASMAITNTHSSNRNVFDWIVILWKKKVMEKIKTSCISVKRRFCCGNKYLVAIGNLKNTYVSISNYITCTKKPCVHWGMGEKGEGDNEVQISNHKINRSRRWKI